MTDQNAYDHKGILNLIRTSTDHEMLLKIASDRNDPLPYRLAAKRRLHNITKLYLKGATDDRQHLA